MTSFRAYRVIFDGEMWIYQFSDLLKVTASAPGEAQTCNLTLTREVLYHCTPPAAQSRFVMGWSLPWYAAV